MLVFGDHNSLVNDGTFTIFNLSSLIEGFEVISIIPPFIKQFNDDKQFDMMYAEYLISNENVFYEMMKIIMSIYLGRDVYILVTKDENSIFDIVTESLQKFLQQRYGLISNNINCIEDLEYIRDDSGFSLNGTFNLDQDKARFTYMYYSRHPEELKEQP